MRLAFCDAMVRRAADPRLLFLTGDLGFMALEPLQAALGERFVNAGVAEQNMVTVAAALARQRFEVWAYSIAPFCYARPFEQIRNDVTFHALPVKLVGNGGGYGYGVMGPTHHAIEDYGVLLALPNLSAFVPVFDEDIAAVVERVGASTDAAYLRLGRGEPPPGYAVPPYAAWRELVAGGSAAGPLVIAVGPLAGTYIEACRAASANLWALAELPLARHPLPDALRARLAQARVVCVAEEHVARGGAGSELALWCALNGVAPRRFVHLHARAHHFERYGSQKWLRERSALDPQSLLAALEGA